MAEYPPRSCGPCPHLGAFKKAPEYGDYLEKNTTPQPEVIFEEQTKLNEHHLATVKTNFPPDLTVSPIQSGNQQSDVEFGGIPTKYQVSAPQIPVQKVTGKCNTSCLNESAAKTAVTEPCPPSPYNLKQPSESQLQVTGGDQQLGVVGARHTPYDGGLGDKPSVHHLIGGDHQVGVVGATPNTNGITTQPSSNQLRGILKYGNNKEASCCCPNETIMAAASRLPPGEIDPSAQVPVPNELRPIPNELQPPCYLPQPQDEIPAEMEETMGPIGPWATGRVDWGPLSGLTGTRPIVDKYSIARFSEGDWRKHNKEMLDMSLENQHKFNLIDWNGRRCLEQICSDTDKNQSDNTKRLLQREQEVHRWKCELERAIAAAAEEISLLEEQRHRLKRAAAVLQLPESIAGECIERRTGRLDPEVVRDDVEEELIKELALIAEIKDQFARTLKDVELQVLEDKTAKQRLEYDWSDKKEAHEIEALNVSLNYCSNTLLFKPGATRFPNDQSTPEYWEHFTRETLQEGEATRQRSVTLRGTLDAILLNAARDLRSQADRVETALSKRIACTEQIRMHLENELKKILQGLADAEDLIRDLRDAIRRMDTPMKKAQTRLDNRNQRPRVESCRDIPHFGLVEEVKSIGEGVSALLPQLKQAEQSLASMLQARNDLEREIMVKRKTLEIDRLRIQHIRSFYPSANALSGH